MSDPRGIDERLRAVLGPGGPLDASGTLGGSGGAAGAKARVLAGIRRRRLHRLGAIGAACLVALAVAISLPVALGVTAPSAPVTGTAATSSGAGTHGTEALSRAPARVLASCRLYGKAVAPCGHLAKGTAAQRLSATAGASGNAAAADGSIQSVRALGTPLVVRRGATVVVALPRLMARWRWETPGIAGTATYHGSGPPVIVQPARSLGRTQRFVVSTRVPATFVLEAREDVFAGTGAEPSIVNRTWPVWALELKVVGK